MHKAYFKYREQKREKERIHAIRDKVRFSSIWSYRSRAHSIEGSVSIHLNLVLVKLLELHHLGYDLRHYHAQHHAFIKQFNLPAHFQFDVAAG